MSASASAGSKEGTFDSLVMAIDNLQPGMSVVVSLGPVVHGAQFVFYGHTATFEAPGARFAKSTRQLLMNATVPAGGLVELSFSSGEVHFLPLV